MKICASNMEENVLDLMLEILRCSICKNYLSSPPIELLPDGSSICSYCSPKADDGPTYREFTLEAILSKITFPCRFDRNGCTERLIFCNTRTHEAMCNYRSFNCPAYTNEKECSWSGPVLDFLGHFAHKHGELIAKNVAIKLDMEHDQRGLQMITIDNNTTFIVKHFFNHATCTLRYDIRYLNSDVQRAYNKIKISNYDDIDCSVTLKKNKCIVFKEAFYNAENSKILKLKNYLKNLDNPENLLIDIDLFVSKRKSVKSEVNYEVLETLRCIGCKDYLVPPIFECKRGTICCFCSKRIKDCRPSQNEELKSCVYNAIYPCRWRNCDFVTKSAEIREHERVCQHRIYDCLSCNCDVTFNTRDARNHLESHGYRYFDDVYVYEVELLQPTDMKTIFTIKYNEIVSLNHRTYISPHQSEHKYLLSLNVSNNNSANISARVQFEHQHCKIKSEAFNVRISMCFGINNFPHCYKLEDRLKITLSV